MARKRNTVIVKLVSSAGTGYNFIATKNPKKLTKKLDQKAYDPIARKHVMFAEKKYSS